MQAPGHPTGQAQRPPKDPLTCHTIRQQDTTGVNTVVLPHLLLFLTPHCTVLLLPTSLQSNRHLHILSLRLCLSSWGMWAEKMGTGEGIWVGSDPHHKHNSICSWQSSPWGELPQHWLPAALALVCKHGKDTVSHEGILSLDGSLLRIIVISAEESSTPASLINLSFLGWRQDWDFKVTCPPWQCPLSFLPLSLLSNPYSESSGSGLTQSQMPTRPRQAWSFNSAMVGRQVLYCSGPSEPPKAWDQFRHHVKARKVLPIPQIKEARL